jgi:hypothetical protein
VETLKIALTIAAWKKSWGPRGLLRLSMGLILVLSLPFSRAAAQEKQDAPNPQRAITKVIILPPEVVFEGFAGTPFVPSVPVPTNTFAMSLNGAVVPVLTNTFGPALTNAANVNLNTRKYTVVTPESLQDPKAIEWLKQLQPLTSRLARGAINDEAQQILSHLGALPEDYLILVQFMRAKEITPVWQSPPVMTSPMSSTLLQAALISTRTGRVVWKNEVLKWELYPAADSPKFAKSIHLLYSTLGAKGGN